MLFLAVAVCVTDLTYRVSRRVGRFIVSRYGLAARMASPATASPGFSSAFLVAGLIAKLIFLGATAALTGARTLSELRPADSIGLGAIVMLADFLIPYGVAALRRALGARPGQWSATFSCSPPCRFIRPTGVHEYVLIYGVAHLLAEGWNRTRREFVNWKSVLILGIAIFSLGIKSQQRAACSSA